MTVDVINFRTPDYERVYDEHLGPSVAALPAGAVRLHASVLELDGRSWSECCCAKPLFIATMLQQLNKPVMWCDADQKIHQPPTYFEEHGRGFDFAVGLWGVGGAHCGTMFIAPTQTAFDVLAAWEDACQQQPETRLGDQTHFLRCATRCGARILDLPRESYGWIYRPSAGHVEPGPGVVVSAWQASRTMRLVKRAANA